MMHQPLYSATLRQLSSFLWAYTRPFFYQLMGIAMSIFLGAFAVLMGGQSLKKLTQGFHHHLDTWEVFGWLMGVGLLLTIIAFHRTYQTTMLASKIVSLLREKLAEKSFFLSKGTIDELPPGSLVQIWQSDMSLLERVIGQSLPIFARSVLQLMGGLGLFVQQSISLASLTFLLIVGVGLPFRYAAKALKKAGVVCQQNQGKVVEFLTNLWDHLTIVSALSAQPEVLKAYTHLENDYTQAFQSRTLVRSAFIALIIGSVVGSLIFLLYYGRQEVLQGGLSTPDLMAFAYYAVIIASSLNAVTEHLADIQGAAMALGRVESFLTLAEERKGGRKPGRNLSLTFEDVVFSYPSHPSTAVLKGLSFSWPWGTTLGLVGPSGGGKSTLLKLILGFYRPQSGFICVRKELLQRIDLRAWRQSLMWISQETFIIPGSLRLNLTFGLGEFSDHQLFEALERVALKDLIDRWPQGLGTLVGAGGQPLSGGERQKLALARALLSQRPVLLFDEPTSALDAESDEWVADKVLPLFKGKSCLMIAHRLASLKTVDKILVLDQGTILEEGTHLELLAKKGMYAQYVQHQSRLGSLG